MKLVCVARVFSIFSLAILLVLTGPGITSTALGVTHGYVTAVLRSECSSDPMPPPAVGGTNVGADFVILTVADADPRDWSLDQGLVADSVFESIMPLYCALPENSGTGCVSDSVQWGIVTYDTNGNPVTSGCAASGCQFRSCAGFESGAPIIVTEPVDVSVNSGQQATFSVDASGVAPLSYQWVFDGTNVLAGATNSTLVLANAQTSEQGSYAVFVANSLGETNSVAATLTVNPGPAATKGYITAVLRSGCTSAPTPPPPVGYTNIGPDYVIFTVADADPGNFSLAQELVTDAVFESIMPLYCALPENSGTGCVSDSVQWNIITYDTNGNPVSSACAASGCQAHSCMGYESGPPIIISEPVDESVNSGQQVTFSVDASGVAPLSYQWVFDGTNVVPGATNSVLVLASAQTNQAGSYTVFVANSLGATNSQPATLTVNPGPAATNGYITAVLRSDCTDAPTPPPPVGYTNIGPDYVILTVADADPRNWSLAQKLVTDADFESIMPLYCALKENSGTGCVTDLAQWNIITYDVNGNPVTSGCAASGCQAHSCSPLPPLAAQLSSTNIAIQWPTNSSNYVLEVSSDLVNWSPAGMTNSSGGQLVAPLSAQKPGVFYRLRHK